MICSCSALEGQAGRTLERAGDPFIFAAAGGDRHGAVRRRHSFACGPGINTAAAAAPRMPAFRLPTRYYSQASCFVPDT